MNKAKRKGIIFLGLLTVLLVYILFLDSASFWRRFQMSYRLSKLQADLEFLKEENARLQSENQDLENNPETWERKARDLGMQKKDEEIFIFKEKGTDDE